MPSREHQQAIRRFRKQFPRAQSSGFMRELRAILTANGVEIPPERVTPDAYLIDYEERAIIVFEVEHKQPVEDEKLERYRLLAWSANEAVWTMVLIIERWGVRTGIDLILNDIENIVRKHGKAA